MSPLPGLDYAPHIDPIVLARLEMAARDLGLPLARLELLGQCEQTARKFIAAAASGEVDRVLAEADWDRLESLLGQHDAFAPGIGNYPAL